MHHGPRRPRFGLRASRLVLAVGLALATGCGAAYYGTAIAIVATEGDEETDTSFPDAKPDVPVVPAFVELELGSDLTVTRRVGGGFPTSGSSSEEVTAAQVLGFNFPAGYGETISNRDAGITLADTDRLVIRINGAANEELTGFGATFSTGADVAGALQAAIRALDPTDANVAELTVAYDEATGSYRFRTGEPSEEALIEFEPDDSTGGADTDSTSTATAGRLGLGVANGGIERSGGESVRLTLLNHGTDSIPSGVQVTLYLSEDKELDTDDDFPIDVMQTTASIAVGEAQTLSRTNGSSPPVDLVRSDFGDGKHYLLFDVSASGGEKFTGDNLVNSLAPVMVYDPTTAADPDELDFAPTSSSSPISMLLGNQLTTTLNITNYGAAVTATESIDIDLVLSADETFDDPAGFFDENGIEAGLYINPRDPNETITVELTTGAALDVTVDGDTLTVTYDAGGTETVTDLIIALNNSAGQRVDAFHDGVNDPDNSTIVDLVAGVADTTTEAIDIYVTSRTVDFPAADEQTTRPFTVGAELRDSAILASRLPTELFPLYRIRPTTAENPENNLRAAHNFVRIYDTTTATLDVTTGTLLPTVNDDDFSPLEAVTQRPVNSGSIRQGQQRVFRFEIPELGLGTDASQLLVVLSSDDFDPHLDLLTSNGTFIAGSDDSDLGLASLVYTPVEAPASNRSFYAVVSPARADGSDLTSGDESFELTISVNARDTDDTGLVRAVELGSVNRGTKVRYETGDSRIDNDVLVPIDLSNSKAEVMFVLPTQARVRLRTTPVFTVGVETEFTGFVPGTGSASPVEFQARLDGSATGIVYKPSGGNIADSHLLSAGVYTIAFEGLDGVGDDQTDLRLEIDTEFAPVDAETSE
jgi:hypothetical protein